MPTLSSKRFPVTVITALLETEVADAVRVCPTEPVIDLLAAYEFCGSVMHRSRLKISALRIPIP